MRVIVHFILIFLLGTSFVSAEWKVKRKQKIRVSNIIVVEKNTPLLSCQVKCNFHQDCYEIGVDKDLGLGMKGDCYLLRKNDYSDSGLTTSSASIVTKEMYVFGKHDLCKKSKCRDDQKCVIIGTRYSCVCKNGLTTDNCQYPLSCDTIKKSNPKTVSGFYTINPSKPVSVYCDMDIDTNGWMLIANITLSNPISNAEAKKLSSLQSLSNDIEQLNQVMNGRFRFNPVRLANFDASFKYLHFYCKKGSQTISITTLNKNILDYFMLKTNTKPAACSSFKRLPEDNSRLTARCSQWVYSKWAGLSNNANRLYHFPFYISGWVHYGIRDTRYECDDYGSTNAGIWKIYVK